MTNLIIIDDEVKLRGLLKRILELEGYHVSEAGDARSAFATFRKTRYSSSYLRHKTTRRPQS
jgi:DNA-binding response OmpR family regulator